MKRIFVVLMSLLMFLILGQVPVMASGDLDDGISKFSDDSIAADDELGKPGKNIKFIIENAKSKAKVAEKGAGKSNGKGKTSGDTNENSIVMGAGSNVYGDQTIVVVNSPGSKK